jgi:hypothetical protein
MVERLQEKYICQSGDNWEVWLVVYSTDRYVVGGKDEVFQYKKNDYEVGHLTRHLDGDDRLLQENSHGITSVPKDCKKV